MALITLDALDLAALLCSRVCHDVISPVGAIVNGLEIIEDSDDASTHEFALDMIKKSAENASSKLKFARLAYGASGSAGSSIDLADAEAAARGMFQDDKTSLSWAAPRALVPKNRVKLLLNLVVLATSAIPRGGSIAVQVEGEDPDMCEVRLEARGINARIPPHAAELLAGSPESGVVDAHVIQTFYAGMLAREVGMTIALSLDADVVSITARNAEAQG